MIENLPRPWFLAALTGMSMAELIERDQRAAMARLRHPQPRVVRLQDMCETNDARRADREARLN